jgi:hypothetical protein
VVEKKGLGAAAISMSNFTGRELIVVPIWIALSSTVILYNSKSDLQWRTQLRWSEYLYTNLDFPYVSHPKYTPRTSLIVIASLHVRQSKSSSRRRKD